MHVVIVGSGVAGLIAALEASLRHDVTLVTKSALAESNTKYAQGGIAAVMAGPDALGGDAVASHVADTLVAGAGLSDPEIVRILCSDGPDRVRDLIRLGVAFDLENGMLARGHEAAHSHKRVLHAGGDATGLAIELALVESVRSVALDVHENAFVRDLIVRDGQVVGVSLADRDVYADAVILASGGAGQLYAHTTNPVVTTGDGVAAAWRAGAVLADLEFYQFHPTSLAVPGNPLVSEAVRGEGAVLLSADGRRFMLDVHPGAELAPRDVVARGIAAQMAAQGGAPVLLDATALGEDFLRTRFPGITASLHAHGLSWCEPFPVTPAAHYWMGGVRTDKDGRTSLPGLYAVGEVACTGVHGANRLASNSLLESLVFSYRAAAALDTPFVPYPDGDGAPASALRTAEGEGAVADRHALQQLMWDAAGVYRDGDGLRAAQATLDRWTAAPGTEDANLLDVARLVVSSALAREESRGAHYRDDFPLTDPDWAHHSLVAMRVPAHV